MRKDVFLLTAVGVVLGLAGCSGPSSTGDLLVVNFQKNQPLRYRMVSQRQTQIDLAGDERAKQSKPQTMTEQMELVMVYTPVTVDPFGLTILNVTCESAKVTRSSFSGKQAEPDAVESLPGMSYTLAVTPTGQIDDLSDFKRVVRQLGDKAFATVPATAGRVKNPDMISDFVALQLQLWNSIASIKNPDKGLSAGKTWQTRQLLPWPIPVPNPPTCITTFTVDSISGDNPPRKAAIKSTYVMTEDFIKDVPMAYEGSFQMRGLFGFLRQYQFESITGSGEQVFNIDAGILEKDHQQYAMDVSAAFAFPLGNSQPILKVNQTLSVELLQ